uniref:Capsid protein n=1 Tax=Panagrolaimus sp. JU765 TaxID=591449 RepID=A0AC34RI17_9BILA
GFKNTTVPRTLYNYFYYRLLLTYSDYFPVASKSAELQDDIDFLEMMEYKKPQIGRPKFTESRRTRLAKIAKAKQGKDLDETAMACIDDTVNYFDDASTRVLVDQIYPTQANKDFIKTNVGNLAQTIMIGMQSMIDGLNWMTPQTKAGAYAKISQLTRNIAYPDYVVDDTKLTAHYSDLDNFINETNYYNILSSLQKFTVHNSLMNLLKTTGTDRHDFNGPAGIVNAWYQPEQNSITFPAGILRMPFYDPDWPKSVVLGAMG